MIHEDTGELLADGLCHQSRRNRRIHTAGERKEHLAVAYGLADALNLCLREAVHLPIALAAADIIEEVVNQLFAVLGVLHFRVELGRVDVTRRILHGRNRAVLGVRGHGKAGRHFGDIVRVGHPAGNLSRNAAEQRCIRLYFRLGLAVLADRCGLNLAVQSVRNQLCAVAEAENRNAEIKHLGIDVLALLFEDGLRSARKNEALRLHCL